MARHERTQWASLDLDGVRLLADLSAGISLARPVQFEGTQLRCFGAPPARSVPLASASFSGRVERGAGCNCSTVTLTAHANGTHTECAAHLTLEPLDAWRVIPQRLLVAVLLSVAPQRAVACPESSEPEPQPDDELITRAALERAWPASLAERLVARAAVIRTVPNASDKFAAVADPAAAPCGSEAVPPFLSLPAAELLLDRGIAHLVLDVPSADRAADGGALSVHRRFFGLPARGTHLAQAQRPDSTITELAYIEDRVADGWYLLSLQSSAIAGDAVPSRPLLYPLRLA
jgi:Putative cyclase